jgi:predicted DCC family thiol-disulfide oxidoreductase YuxK
MSDQSPILLYDGTCGFCAKSVQFVLTRERQHRTLRFAPLQSALGGDIQRRHPELARVDSVFWFEPASARGPEQIYVRSTAVLRVLRYLGGVWRPLGLVAAVVPRVVRDWVYDFVARHRHQIIRADASCLLPTPEQRARFIA